MTEEQSVSKWEGAQSVPDLEKILRLSELFGVSTDYLLKDDIEETETEETVDIKGSVKRVSMEEACRFLKVKGDTAKNIAFATFLCVISPICLMILGVLSEMPEYGISENAAAGVGMIVLLLIIAGAVAIFIVNGSKTQEFLYLEKEVIETEYGVRGMVKEQKEKFKGRYTRDNIIGACMCIISLIPIFAGVIIDENNDLLMVSCVCALLFLAAIGVFMFVRCGIIWESFEKLLQEGEYSEKNKKRRNLSSALNTVYWLSVLAIFLAFSLYDKKNWDWSWIIWAIAGVLYPVFLAAVNIFRRDK